MSVRERHTRQPLVIAATASTHGDGKMNGRTYTRTTSWRPTTRQTSQNVADCVDVASANSVLLTARTRSTSAAAAGRR